MKLRILAAAERSADVPIVCGASAVTDAFNRRRPAR
jgi:hypothetical protein